MLVLSRKVNQSIYIGPAKVLVADIRGDKVRLGVQAPVGVLIYREELSAQFAARVRDPLAVALERIAGIVAAVRRGADMAAALDDIEAQVRDVME